MAVQLQPNFLTERFDNMKFAENKERSMSEDSTDSNFELKIIEEEDKNDVIELARKFFNRDEPLNEYIGLTGPDGRCSDLEDYLVSTIKEGTSVKAVLDGKMVAIMMNGVMTREDEIEKSYVDNPKFQKILDFLHYNTEKCNIFERYPEAQKVMSLKIISVDPCMRGKGVATKMAEKTREIAKEKGCQLMYCECTSYISALIMKRLGFKMVYSLPYSEYKVDGKVVFQPKKPHTEYTVYVQDL